MLQCVKGFVQVDSSVVAFRIPGDESGNAAHFVVLSAVLYLVQYKLILNERKYAAKRRNTFSMILTEFLVPQSLNL